MAACRCTPRAGSPSTRCATCRPGPSTRRRRSTRWSCACGRTPRRRSRSATRGCGPPWSTAPSSNGASRCATPSPRRRPGSASQWPTPARCSTPWAWRRRGRSAWRLRSSPSCAAGCAGPDVELDGPDGRRYFVALHDDVYRPSDDTMLLARAVHAEVRRGERFLEVGCGAGFVSLVAAGAGAAVTCTDANPHAVALARHNARQNGLPVTAAATALLAGLAGPFDVAAFTPPYLPTAPDEYVPGPLNLAFDGGPDGNAVVLRFAAQLQGLRALPRCVLVVHSSLSDPGPLRQALGRLGYGSDVAAEEAHAFERLTVQRFRAHGNAL